VGQSRLVELLRPLADGRPDYSLDFFGKFDLACVVLRPGACSTETLKTELQVHCKRLIATYKYPREIEFVPELPKTTSGKTRHVELRRTEALSCRAPRPAQF